MRSKVKFTPLSAKERFTALTSGEIDILSRNTTWTLSRDADIGLRIRWSKLLRWSRIHGKKRILVYLLRYDFKSGLSACVLI